MDFYLSIYASEYEENDALLEGSSGELPQVSKETNSQLDQPLQMVKLHAALQSMQGRRAPGIDGLES